MVVLFSNFYREVWITNEVLTGPDFAVIHSAGQGCVAHVSCVEGLGPVQRELSTSISIPCDSSVQITSRVLSPWWPSLQLLEQSVHSPVFHLKMSTKTKIVPV